MDVFRVDEEPLDSYSNSSSIGLSFSHVVHVVMEVSGTVVHTSEREVAARLVRVVMAS